VIERKCGVCNEEVPVTHEQIGRHENDGAITPYHMGCEYEASRLEPCEKCGHHRKNCSNCKDKLKMFKFDAGVAYWICAYNKEQAISAYKDIVDEGTFEDEVEFVGGLDQLLKECQDDDTMTYYHDGANGETDTYRNLINKYCDKPDIFACSEF